jgi:uncharacterized membrane protein
MYINNATTSDYAQLVLNIFLAMLFLHQTWANFIQRKISLVSIDRLILILIEIFASPQKKKNVQKTMQSPDRVIYLGVFAFSAFLGALREIYRWILIYN